MNFETVQVNKIKPAAYNPRKLSEQGLKDLIGSIQYTGLYSTDYCQPGQYDNCRRTPEDHRSQRNKAERSPLLLYPGR